jgi:hypothetical protein
MKSLRFCPVGLFVLISSLAFGQATRTWVSGVGDDANPCSRTAPCKTWAGAISKTAPGGEIDALDPGGFGAVTITKALTLDGGGGQVASTLVTGSVNGIVVAAGASDVVTLRNLRITGASGGGTLNGVRFLSGKLLQIENCFIFGFGTNGIDIALGASGHVVVHDTTSSGNGQVGLRAQTSSGTVQVTIDNSYFTGNGFGVWADNNSKITVTRSVAGDNSAIGFISQATTSGTSTLALNQDISSNNGVGLQVGGGTGSSVLHYGGMTTFNNATGVVNGANGVSHSFGNSSNLDGGIANGSADSPTN